jgi:hypothetical protein
MRIAAVMRKNGDGPEISRATEMPPSRDLAASVRLSVTKRAIRHAYLYVHATQCLP